MSEEDQLELVEEVTEMSHQQTSSRHHLSHGHRASICRKMTRIEMMNKDSEVVLGSFRPVVNPNFKVSNTASLDKTITKLA